MRKLAAEFLRLARGGARAPQFAPLALALALSLVHLISIPVANLSVNPARSTATALFLQHWAVQQLWLFWVAPLAGAVLSGFLFPMLTREAGRAPSVGSFPPHSAPKT